MTAGHEVHHVEPVKLPGPTWYQRGTAYWIRREFFGEHQARLRQSHAAHGRHR